MSVIVKGMEMPKNCQECDLYIEDACYAKGYRDYRSIMDKSKPDDCPLIELPFAEELAEKLYKQIEKAVIEGSET